jgi:hypothetical protein
MSGDDFRAKGEVRSGEGKGTKLHAAPIPDAVSRAMLLAIGVGFVLVLAALGTGAFIDMPRRFQDLLIATGVALIVTAFGGQGTIQWRVAIFAGVTATMLGLLWFLSHLDSDAKFLKGQISGIDWEKYDPELKFENYVLSHFDRQSDALRFAVFETDLTTASAVLLMNAKDGTEQQDIRIHIAVQCFHPYLRKKDSIDWSFDSTHQVLLDLRNNRTAIGGALIPAEGAPDIVPCSVSRSDRTAFSSLEGSFAITAARASDGKQMPLDQSLLQRSLMELRSDETDLRRSARDVLATAAPTDLPILMGELHRNPEYRTQLGIVVALTEMLRINKSLAREIAANLTTEDKREIVNLAGHSDKTMRQYATEFLFDLADPEAASLALARAAVSTDPKARYNWLFASRDGWVAMDKEQKAVAAPLIEKIRSETASLPQTTKLLEWYGQ